jgi:pimeloyl-ACP methyl ester carboxylesterase
VLLVHGYICNHRVWDKLARVLQRAGHPVLAVNLEPLFDSIDDYAPILERAVTSLQQQTGAKKIALIGHSMGGLAIRSWMRRHGHARVAQVITLGTPHWGTQIATYSPSINGAQMIWQSRWLHELHDSESGSTRALLHIALSQHDSIVFPQRAQVLAGAAVTEFKGIGHLALCQNQQVIQWVQRLLEAPAAQPIQAAVPT